MREIKATDTVTEEVWRALWKLGGGNENQNILQEKYIFYNLLYILMIMLHIYSAKEERPRKAVNVPVPAVQSANLSENLGILKTEREN